MAFEPLDGDLAERLEGLQALESCPEDQLTGEGRIPAMRTLVTSFVGNLKNRWLRLRF